MNKKWIGTLRFVCVLATAAILALLTLKVEAKDAMRPQGPEPVFVDSQGGFWQAAGTLKSEWIHKHFLVWLPDDVVLREFILTPAWSDYRIFGIRLRGGLLSQETIFRFGRCVNNCHNVWLENACDVVVVRDFEVRGNGSTEENLRAFEWKRVQPGEDLVVDIEHGSQKLAIPRPDGCNFP